MSSQRGGLSRDILGCIVWFTGRLAYNRGGGGEAYKRQFTDCIFLINEVDIYTLRYGPSFLLFDLKHKSRVYRLARKKNSKKEKLPVYNYMPDRYTMYMIVQLL